MNIANLLKYCPKGTKLYSTVFGEVTFDRIDMDEKYPILVYKIDGACTSFDEKGRYVKYYNSECVLFPSKDQRDWSEFRIPLKRGDIMMKVDGTIPFIASGEFYEAISPKYICGVDVTRHFSTGIYGWTSEFYIPASKEAKEELFDKMAEAGYKWNTDTLELEKIEPKFKEGDVLINSETNTLFLSVGVMINDKIQGYYLFANGKFAYSYVSISLLKLASITDRNKLFSTIVKSGYKYDKEQHKLVKQEFKPFDKVLVRDKDTDTWEADIYLGYNEEDRYYRYKCTSMNYQFCIPYEGNEYLLGTTDSPTYNNE